MLTLHALKNSILLDLFQCSYNFSATSLVWFGFGLEFNLTKNLDQQANSTRHDEERKEDPEHSVLNQIRRSVRAPEVRINFDKECSRNRVCTP